MEIYESGASEINLAKDAQVFLDGKAVSVVHDGDVHSEWKPVNAQEGGFGLWTWVKPSALSSVKLWFDTDRTRFAEVKLEVSADGSNSNPFRKAKSSVCFIKRAFTTVGHTERVGGTPDGDSYLSGFVVQGHGPLCALLRTEVQGRTRGAEAPVEQSGSESQKRKAEDQRAGRGAWLAFVRRYRQTVGIPHCYNEK